MNTATARGLKWPKKEHIEEFFSLVLIPNDPDICHVWVGNLDVDGYGEFNFFREVTGSNRRASRFAWAIHTGEKVPKGVHILHSCDYRRCVNPRHLRAGTAQDNIRDRTERNPYLQGSRNPNSVLNEDDVRNIRERLASGEPANLIARSYGVVPTTIGNIKNNNFWKKA